MSEETEKTIYDQQLRKVVTMSASREDFFLEYSLLDIGLLHRDFSEEELDILWLATLEHQVLLQNLFDATDVSGPMYYTTIETGTDVLMEARKEFQEKYGSDLMTVVHNRTGLPLERERCPNLNNSRKTP